MKTDLSTKKVSECEEATADENEVLFEALLTNSEKKLLNKSRDKIKN